MIGEAVTCLEAQFRTRLVFVRLILPTIPASRELDAESSSWPLPSSIWCLPLADDEPARALSSPLSCVWRELLVAEKN